MTVALPGEGSRPRQIVLYVAEKCESARYFGPIKLNKIIWKADFDSFASRGIPVTGREYVRQQSGPELREMVPLLEAMLRDGAIRIERRDFADGIVEMRTIALDRPEMSLFSEEDVSFIDASILHYWDMTGTESGDRSHGVAWQTRVNGDPMPYEASLLSDASPGPEQWKRLGDIVRRREITTL